MNNILLLQVLIIAASVATGCITWYAAVKKYRKEVLALEKEVLELSWCLLDAQKNDTINDLKKAR